MTILTLNIPDAQLTRVVDAFVVAYEFKGTAPDGTPETKQQFMRRIIMDFVRNTVRSVEVSAAAEAARVTEAAKPSVNVT